MLKAIIILSLLGVACAAPREPTLGDASPEELDAANIIHGEARTEFEAHVASGGAFLLVGACNPALAVVSVSIQDREGRSFTATLNDARMALVPVIPGDYVISGAEFAGRAPVAFPKRPSSAVVARAITFIGGVQSEAATQAIACSSLPRRAVQTYPYQIVRLPFHYGDGLER